MKGTSFREEDLVPTALADASVLLGVDLNEADVLGSDVVRWTGTLPFAAVGHQANIAKIRVLVQDAPGLLLVGGWLSGNGLAAIVAGTRRAVRAAVDTAQRV